MLKNLIKRLLFKHNYKEICLRLNTWYTISGVQNTNQIQTLWDSRISKIWKLLRNSKWTLMWNNFSRVLALVNCCVSLTILYFFTPLYRGVKETLYNVSTSKRVVWSLIKSPMICCLIWLLSYGGAISNPFPVWRNIVAGTAVVLVLTDIKTE